MLIGIAILLTLLFIVPLSLLVTLYLGLLELYYDLSGKEPPL